MIRRPRFRRDENAIAATLRTIRTKALWVRPSKALQKCGDLDDKIFLECAQAARAIWITSASWHDARIVTARRFLEIMPSETVEL